MMSCDFTVEFQQVPDLVSQRVTCNRNGFFGNLMNTLKSTSLGRKRTGRCGVLLDLEGVALDLALRLVDYFELPDTLHADIWACFECVPGGLGVSVEVQSHSRRFLELFFVSLLLDLLGLPMLVFFRGGILGMVTRSRKIFKI